MHGSGFKLIEFRGKGIRVQGIACKGLGGQEVFFWDFGTRKRL